MNVSELIELLKQLDSDATIEIAVREHDGRDGGWKYRQVAILPKREGGFILIEQHSHDYWKREKGDAPFWDSGLV